MNYELLEQKITRWAHSQPDVLAVVVVGSRARPSLPADDWSDLDLILFVADMTPYAQHTDWSAAFGEALVPVFDRHQSGDIEWLILFADGLKVDFYFTPGTAVLDNIWPAATYAPVMQRGSRLLYARLDVTLTLETAVSPPRPKSPTQDEFLAVFHDALLKALRAAKFLRRDDSWHARRIIDRDLRDHVLTMTTWHAQAQHGPDYDTWYDGRYLEKWADGRVPAALPTLFGGYSLEAAWHNLFGALSLFRWLAQETAVSLTLTYPQTADQRVMDWIRGFYLTRNDKFI